MHDWSVTKVLEVVDELRSDGLKRGTDFDFAYHPTTYEDWLGDNFTSKHTVFTFYKEDLATWFRLKYE